MQTWEAEHWYDEYCDECEEKGIEPKDIETWWKELDEAEAEYNKKAGN